MSFDGFAAPGELAPAELPAALQAAQGIVTLRWASAGYATRPTDVPASTPYLPRVLGDVTVSQQAMDAVGLGGVVALTAGDVDLWDGDGALLDLDRYGTADRRPIRIRALPVLSRAATDFGSPFGAAGLVFSGRVGGVYRSAPGRGRLALGDSAELLSVPLQPTRYAGTGGTEGGADLAGRPKPVALGRVFNAAPVYLGRVDLGDGLLDTYQCHWRAVQAIDAVRIRGVAQTLVGAAPVVGQARAWAASGLFQLGSSPDGEVTCDIRGDNVGGYVSTTASILQRALTSLGPQLSAADFDAVAQAFADNDLPGEVGWYSPGDDVTALSCAAAIVAGCGAVLAGARDGRLRLFDPLASDAPQLVIEPSQIVSLVPRDLPSTVRPTPIAAAVRWRRNWAPLGNPAAGIPAADRQALTSEASGPERAVTTAAILRQASQRDLAFNALYWAQSDAAARAARWRDWLDHGPRCLELVTDRYLGQVECGHIGRLSYPAFGLDAGARFVVLGWSEAVARRRLTLTCCTIPEG